MPINWNTLIRGSWKWWFVVLFCLLLISLLGVLVLGSGTTYRSMGYRYPVTVEVPDGEEVAAVSYYCMFDRAQADYVVDHLVSNESLFEPAGGLHFVAEVSGHRNTRWYGLVENAGHEDVLIVIVDSVWGERFIGIADIPDERTGVTVVVSELP